MVRYRKGMRCSSLTLTLMLMSLAACSDSALSDYMDEDLPAGQCEDTEGEACETGGAGDQCNSSQDCGGDLVCGASFNGDIGTFECQAACVPTMDESMWCIDDTSCCDAAATCGPRGYCTIAGSAETGLEETGTETGTDTGVDTSTGTGSETDAGTTESSGTSDDGASTSTGGQ